MASRRPRQSETSADLISQLPEEVKHIILEFLDTRDAARTALLSTEWKDVWLRHDRLVFDWDFFECIGHKPFNFVNMISNILLHRIGRVKKFTLMISDSDWDPLLQQSHLDEWCLFLTRNGIEILQIFHHDGPWMNTVPICLLSCSTINELKLDGFIFYCPVNACRIFSGLTSLVFSFSEFKPPGVNGIVSTLPNLEKLGFENCGGFDNFVISAPKLQILTAVGFDNLTTSRWFELHLKVIGTLCLSVDMFADLLSRTPGAAASFPMAINLQVMVLYDFSFFSVKQFTFVIHLIQKCPKLSQLEIVSSDNVYVKNDEENESRLFEGPDLKMLKTVKFQNIWGFELEVLFIKTILSKSPVLEELVIHEVPFIDPSVASKISRELLCAPCASPKAQVVFLDRRYTYPNLIQYPSF